MLKYEKIVRILNFHGFFEESTTINFISTIIDKQQTVSKFCELHAGIVMGKFKH